MAFQVLDEIKFHARHIKLNFGIETSNNILL